MRRYVCASRSGRAAIAQLGRRAKCILRNEPSSCLLGEFAARLLGGSIIVMPVGSLVWAAAHAKTGPSLPWLATIQGGERKEDLASLAPKRCFIPTEAVKRVAGQIGETQKAPSEVRGLVCKIPIRAQGSFRIFCDVVCIILSRPLLIGSVRPNIALIILRVIVLVSLACSLELQQMLCLDLEQAGFHGRSAANPP